MCGDAEGVQAEHLASLLQTLVNGGPQARQKNVTLPQAVNVNRKCSEVLREDQLQDRRLESCDLNSAPQKSEISM